MHQTDTLQEYVDSADDMLARGIIDIPLHAKLLVQLSFEFLQKDQEKQAFALLNRVDRDYYAAGGTLHQQAKVDKHYAELVVKLAYRLLQLGLVGAEIDLYGHTQKPAQA